MKPAAERGRSPEHIAALDEYDNRERLVKRHQNLWLCHPAAKVRKQPGGGLDPGSWNHLDPDVKAEHDAVIADRDAAREAVEKADPKRRQSTLKDL